MKRFCEKRKKRNHDRATRGLTDAVMEGEEEKEGDSTTASFSR